MRPFKQVHDNLVEITNEVVLLVCLCMLVTFASFEDWTTARTKVFMTILIVGSLLVVVIVAGKFYLFPLFNLNEFIQNNNHPVFENTFTELYTNQDIYTTKFCPN